MSSDPVLKELEKQAQAALEAKELAWQNWQTAKAKVDQAAEAMQVAQQAKAAAEKILDFAYAGMHQDQSQHDAIWDAYGKIRDENNLRINALVDEANHERRKMKDYFDRATKAYHSDNRDKAPYYSQKGYEHRTRYYKLKDEIHDLGEEVKKACRKAEQKAPLVDRAMYETARDDFYVANQDYQEKASRFNKLSTQCTELKKAYFRKARRYFSAKAALAQKQQEIEAAEREINQEIYRRINSALTRSGTRHTKPIEESDAKIIERKREPGIYDVYFAGLSPGGDGEGHGHAVVRANGSIIYLRDAWSNHDDYLIDTSQKRAEGWA